MKREYCRWRENREAEMREKGRGWESDTKRMEKLVRMGDERKMRERQRKKDKNREDISRNTPFEGRKTEREEWRVKKDKLTKTGHDEFSLRPQILDRKKWR